MVVFPNISGNLVAQNAAQVSHTHSGSQSKWGQCYNNVINKMLQ